MRGQLDAAQARWINLIGSQVKADAMNMTALGRWDFEEHPFAAIGGYNEARNIFGGEQSLNELITDFNEAVFGGRRETGEINHGQGHAEE